MCILSDFLPHLPALDIGDGAFDLLFSIYKKQREMWNDGEHLVEQGQIADAHRLEVFLQEIGAQEKDILEQRAVNDAEFLQKKRKWDKRDGKPAGPTDAELAAVESVKASNYQEMLQTLPAGAETVPGHDPKDPFKGRYYYEKLSITPIDHKEHQALRQSYMEGLVWCLAYYYKGCISWEWFFPYHYGPMLSDLIGVPEMFARMNFEMGAPLLPFEQLMACLPPASSVLVPEPFRRLMTSETSPILGFYPTEFRVDMNGKKNPWEGVNLLPFINVVKLKEAINEYCPNSKLTAAEIVRNSFGTAHLYKYDATMVDNSVPCPMDIGLKELKPALSSKTPVHEQTCSEQAFQPNLISGTQVPLAGFPSLNVLPITSVEWAAVGLNCFGSPSKYPNCILTLASMPALPSAQQLASSILNKSLFVNWPMMHEAKVVAIADENLEVRWIKNGVPPKVTPHLSPEKWMADTATMQAQYQSGDGTVGSGGVNIGEIKIRLKLLPLQGMKTNPATGANKKVFGRQEADVPLQLALAHAPAPDPRFQERGPLKLQDRFPVGSSLVLLKGKYQGCRGQVVGILEEESGGTKKKMVGVKVNAVPVEIPFGLALARTVQESYISSSDAARILKIHPGLLGKITGRLPFAQGRYDLGLTLKSADGLCVVGYTRKRLVANNVNDSKKINDAWLAGDSLRVVGSKNDDGDQSEERIQWEYTPKAIRLIEAYRTRFPQLFSGIAKIPNEKKYDANSVFGPNGESWLPVIREWLNQLPSSKLPRSPVTTQSMSSEGVSAVEKAANVRSLALQKRGYPKQLMIKVPGSALYREASTGATDVMEDLNKDAPELGDRIVNLAADGIPFGLRGTVVGIHEAGVVEVVMDEEFMGGTTLQGLCSKFRGKLCPWSRILKIAPEDTKKLVDKLVPRGSGQAAVDKILSSIDPTVNLEQVAAPSPSPAKPSAWTKPTAPAPAAKAKSPQPRTDSAARPKSRSRTPSKMAPSNGGRQAGWREAKGPPEKGTGFSWGKKSARKGKKGVTEWKKSIKAQAATLQLKAVLGVTGSASMSVATAAPSQQSDPPTVASNDAAAATLKAVLGVGAPTPLPAVTHTEQAPVTQPPAAPTSAADRLLFMMSTQQPPQPYGAGAPPQFQPPPQGPSGFNFTYVQEGNAMPTFPPQAPPPPSFMPNMAPMPMPMQGPPQPYPYQFGGPPPPHPAMGMAMNNGMMNPNPNNFAAPAAPSDQFPTLSESMKMPKAKPQKTSSTGVGVGVTSATVPDNEQQAQEASSSSPSEEKSSTPTPPSQFNIVPSVVVRR